MWNELYSMPRHSSWVKFFWGDELHSFLAYTFTWKAGANKKITQEWKDDDWSEYEIFKLYILQTQIKRHKIQMYII